jgi:transposase
VSLFFLRTSRLHPHGDGMQKTNSKKREWKRHKEVNVPWATYDAHRDNEYKYVIDLKNLFIELDIPVQRREFLLSNLAVLLLLKIMFGISYRGIASATKNLGLYKLLKMKRAPSYKTIQRTIQYLHFDFLSQVNRVLTPSKIRLAGIDSSGMKTNFKGAWVQISFKKPVQKKEFKKIHIFVDLESKKILSCIITDGSSYDSPQLKHILQQCRWLKVDILLGDGGYDSKECFNEITKNGIIPGIPVRKNATTRSRGSPSRRKAVIEQRKNIDKWREKVRYNMRCIVEAIFSGTKRRFGEYLFSIKEKHRCVEMWLRTILWNVLIYPR